ncbi:MAG: SBBP repeat-containing protein [Saprospiraceae bacterium]|jgi:hypothetical protein|nr:SBBP repeat-containing protein [Saprospiraceae bacterium]
MKKLFLTVYSCIVAIAIHSQQLAFDWVGAFRGLNSDIGQAIKIDAQGNMITVGSFEQSVDMDPGTDATQVQQLNSNGESDIFISKLDPQGNYIWALQIGGAGDDVAYDLVLDGAGNSYITGAFQQTVDFDPGPGVFELTAVGDYDIFVAKIDPQGQLLWALQIGSPSNDQGFGICRDTGGNLWVTGQLSGLADFDPGPGESWSNSLGLTDIFILKLDSAGQFLFVRTYGGTGDDAGYGICSLPGQGIALTGRFSANVDFDGLLLTSAGQFDAFALSMDDSGALSWLKQFGNTAWDVGRGVSADDQGNVYLVGEFSNTVSFHPGNADYTLSTTGEYGSYIFKLQQDGTPIWLRKLSSLNNRASAGKIEVGADSSVYITGYVYGIVDFDPGAGESFIYGSAYYDIFLLKLDAEGQYQYARRHGFTGFDSGRGLAVDENGYVYVTGSFAGTIYFNSTVPVQSANFSLDAFILKLQPCTPTQQTLVIKTCGPFTINNQTYEQTGMYTQKMVNAKGCDSLLFINLTVYNPTFHTTTEVSCTPVQYNGQLYETSITLVEVLSDMYGCDSTITTHIIINGPNTAVEIQGNTLVALETGATYQWIDCGQGDIAIPGATDQSFTPQSSGSYSVQITSATGCSLRSDCVPLTITGVNHPELNPAMILFPNPGRNQVQIRTKNSLENSILTIYDSFGRKIKQISTSHIADTYIDTGSWPAGMYIFEMNINGIKGYETWIKGE